MVIEVKPAQKEDVELACSIAVEAWKPIYENYRKLLGDELFEMLHRNWQEDKADEIRNHYRRYPDWMLVSEKDGQIAGFITYLLDTKREIGVINNNAVRPEYQRRGIGTLQYQKVLGIFKRSKMRFARVTTGLDESHAPARAAYEKVGFRKAVMEVTYYMKVS